MEKDGGEMGSPGPGWAGWARGKLDPLLVILKKGAEPKQLALSSALGITLGIFPICGTTVILCGVAAALLGSSIHTPTLMLANFVAMPIELSLVVPFLRLGEIISGGAHFALSSDALRMVITGQASRDVLLGVLHVLIGWAVTAPFILVVLYVVFIPCFKVLVRKFSSHPPSPKKTHHPEPEPKPKIRDA